MKRNSPWIPFLFVMAATTIALMPPIGLALAIAGIYRLFSEKGTQRQRRLQTIEERRRIEVMKACMRI